MRTSAAPAPSAIAGGGTVGIELTEAAANAFPGLDITIVEASDQILGNFGYTEMHCATRSASSAEHLGVRVDQLELAYLPRRTSATRPLHGRNQER